MLRMDMHQRDPGRTFISGTERPDSNDVTSRISTYDGSAQEIADANKLLSPGISIIDDVQYDDRENIKSIVHNSIVDSTGKGRSKGEEVADFVLNFNGEGQEVGLSLYFYGTEGKRAVSSISEEPTLKVSTYRGTMSEILAANSAASVDDMRFPHKGNINSITYNNRPSYYSNESSSTSITGTGYFSWNVTDHVQEWVNGDTINNGFTLRSTTINDQYLLNHVLIFLQRLSMHAHILLHLHTNFLFLSTLAA